MDMIEQIPRLFEIALDIGHSSIGWAVFRKGEKFDLLGTGVVLFPADDCLAIKRRAYRRQRRHVRATRQRIERLKKLLIHIGALSEAELNEPGCAWPWKLAAEVLSGNGRLLTWPELWDVLRWYAHNRGYDGNARWSRQEEADPEDTEKEETANSLMQEKKTTTMAETFCAVLEIKPLGVKKSSQVRFKGRNAAFPRRVVYAEVKSILEKHVRAFPHLTPELVRTLVGNDNPLIGEWDDNAWKIITVPEVESHLPKRYKGSYLFGQSVPRFDNRIISICPVTFARTYETERKEGKKHEEALKRARILAKVPAKKSREFLEYRWAMLLGNIHVGITKNGPFRQLNVEERIKLDKTMREKGFLSDEEIGDAVKGATGSECTNLDRMFKITPDADQALVLDPVKKYLATNQLVSLIWPLLPQRLQIRFTGQLWRGKSIRLSAILHLLAKSDFGGNTNAFDDALRKHIADETQKLTKKSKKKGGESNKEEKRPPTFDEMLKRSLKADIPPGRAPFHRDILIQVKNEILAGLDPRKSKKDSSKQNPEEFEAAEAKESDGCLFVTKSMRRLSLGEHLSAENSDAEYQIWRQEWLSKPMNKTRFEKAGEFGEKIVKGEHNDCLTNRWLAQQTNNHLVRHRLFMLGRLLQDIVAEPKFANGDKSLIGKITIEVARDLLAFSGMEKKDIGSDTKGVLGSIKAQHYKVKKWLEEELGENAVDGKLIWKGKVADDLGRKCPYTGEQIRPIHLANRTMDVDHIIPKSQRLTDAMEAVVITFKQINAMKGARTAWQFIEEFGGQKVPGTNLELRPLKGQGGYEEFVKSLKTYSKDSNPQNLPGTQKKHPDYVRRKKRKGFLGVKRYEKDKDKFTPRDLTITSHINRLSQQTILKALPHLVPEDISSIPGTVTGALRDAKGWRLLGCLQAACGDEVMREKTIKDRATGKPKLIKVVKPKGEIRNITHLHHAVDACALGLIAHFIPKNGKIWELIALKDLTDTEKKLWEKLAEDYRWKGYPLSEQFAFSEISAQDEHRNPDPDRKWRLEPKTDAQNKSRIGQLKEQIRQGLAEKRVVQHIPANTSGLAAEETVWRIVDFNDSHPSSKRLQRLLRQKGLEPLTADSDLAYIVRVIRKTKAEKPKKLLHETEKFWTVYDEIAKTKLLGIEPEPENPLPKLRSLKAVKVIADNFGLILWRKDGKPDGELQRRIIVRHKVWPQLEAIAEKENGGKWPEVFRNGQLIRIAKGRYQGVWQISSIKNNQSGLALDIIRPEMTKIQNGVDWAKINVTLNTLIECGMEPIAHGLTGVPLNM
jgi:hypothetical protein